MKQPGQRRGQALIRPGGGAAFTLVELLVAMSILAGIMLVMLGITREVGNAWKNTTGKVENFRNARTAFDAMTRTLGQTTLNTYYDYVDASGNFRGSGMSGSTVSATFAPYSYARQSDLHFICGQGSTLLPGLGAYKASSHAIFFQSALGQTTTPAYTSLDKLLNSCGFFVAYGPDPDVPAYLNASFSTARYRYRLMQFTQAANDMSVYRTSVAAGNRNTWFTTPIQTNPGGGSNFVLAENVIAMIVWPKRASGDQTATNALTTDYSYDSRESGTFNAATSSFKPTFNQLPPIVQVTMVAIDETSAIKICTSATPPDALLGLASPLFTTATYPAAGTQNQLEADLDQLKTSLTAARVNFRIFQTEVAMRGAKWTSN